MMRKIFAGSLAVLILVSITPVSIADSGIKPYKGWAGSDSPLYGIKLYLQKMDISMSGNANDKLNKQLAYADERLAEAQAMAMANNTQAVEAALKEYDSALEDINMTMEAPEINETEYSEVGSRLDRHQEAFMYMLNNTSIPQHKYNWSYYYNNTYKLKTGKPFVYYNNTTYFIPPGQMKKNETFQTPPGLAKKGYAPLPKANDMQIANGSMAAQPIGHMKQHSNSKK